MSENVINGNWLYRKLVMCKMNFQWITQFGCCLRMMNAYICRRKVSTMAEELHRRTHTHIHTHPIPHAPSVDVPSAFHTENFNHFSNYWYEFKCGWNRNFPKSEGRLIENHPTMAYSLCSMINKFPVKLSLLLALFVVARVRNIREKVKSPNDMATPWFTVCMCF